MCASHTRSWYYYSALSNTDRAYPNPTIKIQSWYQTDGDLLTGSRVIPSPPEARCCLKTPGSGRLSTAITLLLVATNFSSLLWRESDLYVPGTRSVLLRNATVWTGADNDTDIIYGADVLLDKGLIVALGKISLHLTRAKNLENISPGIVDAHSHLGVGSAPWLSGASDSNSHRAPTLPWLRSIDGTNTHDLAYRLSMSGGVTTVQVLRPTAERSTSSILLEPPHTLFLNGSDGRPRWRHLNGGKNPMRVHSQTRMDAAWNFRQAYNEARKIKDAQDAFCAVAENGLWDGESAYPESLQVLVDVLRGRVKVSVHCYKLSNEFKFSIASIHHATSTYLVPDLLKQTWGGEPAIALFASDYSPKRETYRTSEFAGRILSDHRLSVVIKSDPAVINSRYLILDPAVALSSVTTNAARSSAWTGGFLYNGYAYLDLVIWDSHPLALGATIEIPAISLKSEASQRTPETPDWEKEMNATLKFDGIPSLQGSRHTGTVRFVNVKSMWTRGVQGLEQRFDRSAPSMGTVVVRDGKVVCISQVESCVDLDGDGEVVDLQGGSLAPGLTSFGSNLGLSEIAMESSTMDGPVPCILGHTVIRAVDGLQFGGRHALLAYQSGVTIGITTPIGRGFMRGVSTVFDLGASGGLDRSAVVQVETALHTTISSTLSASVSTQIAALRNLLFYEDGSWLRVRAYTMARHPLRLTFAGALEAHLLATEIGRAGFSVIVAPGRPFPGTWEMRRNLPGPPLTSEISFTVLLKNGVNVGIGIVNEYDARNARFDMAMVRDFLLAMGSTNIELALRLDVTAPGMDELVAYRGGEIFDMESKVVGVVSARRAVVLF
ncbi:hypothetical protein C8R44DRAFT_827345 [Mycena epipterygia]|nr:hypothetical protein C8R44DRAFT_827345 [Mycena epipterygia]